MPALSRVLNVTGVFDSNKIVTITDSTPLQEINPRRPQGPIVYLGLSYRLGGVAGAPQPGGRGGQRGPRGGGGRRPMPGG
jgi:hypothetical protein